MALSSASHQCLNEWEMQRRTYRASKWELAQIQKMYCTLVMVGTRYCTYFTVILFACLFWLPAANTKNTSACSKQYFMLLAPMSAPKNKVTVEHWQFDGPLRYICDTFYACIEFQIFIFIIIIIAYKKHIARMKRMRNVVQWNKENEKWIKTNDHHHHSSDCVND